MTRWIWITAVVLGLLVPVVWANRSGCGDKEAKAAKTTASGCDKAKTGRSKSADTGGCPKAHAERAFSKLDANGDGKIDREEFASGMPAMMAAHKSGKHAKGKATVTLASTSGKSDAKAGCNSKKAGKAGPSKCAKTTASMVLAAFDLDGNGNLGAAEIERVNKILLVVADVSKTEHTRLSSAGCSKTREAGTSIKTLASRSFDSLKPQETKTGASDKSAASPARGSEAQGG